ncbi:MAG: DUF1778 domain-containing protein [Hormoscilla sp.]
MSVTTKSKKTKIELEISSERKEMLEKAAAMTELSLNDYVVHYALVAAMEHIASHGKMVLADRDREVFMAALENPPEPNEALKAAIEKHQEKYGKW